MTHTLSRAYYSASSPKLVRASIAAVLGELVTHHTFAVDQTQRNAWQAEIAHLQELANASSRQFLCRAKAVRWWQDNTEQGVRMVLSAGVNLGANVSNPIKLRFS